MLPVNQLALIAALRLLIARAANQDSLAWWDDSSLTQPAGVLLERIFPIAPPLAARQLALAAARVRHEAALKAIPNALHLFCLDLDNEVELQLRDMDWQQIPVPADPILSMESLREHLRTLVGEPLPAYQIIQQTPGLQIKIPKASGFAPEAQLARALAWAYLEAKPRQPVFPCVAQVVDGA